MKFRTTIFAALFFSMTLTSCWDVLEGDPCTECQEAIDHLSGAVSSGRLGCTSYVNSTAFARVIAKCTNGRAKAYAVVDAYCTGYGSIPSACE